MRLVLLPLCLCSIPRAAVAEVAMAGCALTEREGQA